MSLRSVLVWGALITAFLVPILAAAMSPLLQWRDPIYIAAGFAGVIGMSLMLIQPLLVIGALPGLSLQASRRVHRYGGTILVLAVVIHMVGLWVTSPRT
ncbi:hypothetical protein [Yoonia sp. GPGPB17]|uniref:hypothetical protein n=1 Tax=Yoonia sp. GPGPB17 TaxID=3026147 RepID=UPI0030EE6611